MKKFASLLIAALTLFAACDEKGPHGPVSYYSISGEISDADGDLLRLTATPIFVRLTDGKGQCVASEEFSLTEENRSFVLTDIPAGKYTLEFYPVHHEDLSCPVIVEKDLVQDVTLTPIRGFTVDQTSLNFPPRCSSQALTITNTSSKELHIFLRPKGNIASFQEIGNALYYTSLSAWAVRLAAGEARQVTVEVHHGDIGQETGFLDIYLGFEGDHRALCRLPISVVTDERDFGPTILGRVTDKQGKPLQGILLECEGKTTLSDEDGRYVFDGPFESSGVNVEAYAEFYNYQRSEVYQCVPADIEIDFALEPCSNHLTLDRTELAFGIGSISEASGTETIRIKVTKEKDDPAGFSLVRFDTDIGTPGFGCPTVSGGLSKTNVLEFTLNRKEGNLGAYKFDIILKTDTAGSYVIPVSFMNTP